MKTPITKTLSKAIIDSIDAEKIIYAEVTPVGAMGNSGGIIIYILQEDTNEMICYETSIFKDEQTYLLADKKLYKHLDREEANSKRKNLYLFLYYGGMGNNVFINKNVNLTFQENYFIYTANNTPYQILTSCQGVFNCVVDQLQRGERGVF